MRTMPLLALLFGACVTQASVDDSGLTAPPGDAPCVYYDSLIDQGTIIPIDLEIMVDSSFVGYGGASYPVPGGRMVERSMVMLGQLGAIGRIVLTDGTADQPWCRWYSPINN